MKRNLHIYSLLFVLFLLSGCDKDKLNFRLETFKVNDQFVDDDGRYSDDAVLKFEIKFRSDDPDNDYSLEDFDFVYSVNGSHQFELQSDRNMGVNAFSINAIVDLLNIELPADLQNVLIPGDKILFSVRATDSCGMTIERQFEVVIQ